MLQYLRALAGVSLSRIGKPLSRWLWVPLTALLAATAVYDYRRDSDLFYLDLGLLAVLFVCIGLECWCWLIRRRLERLRARRAQ